MSRKLDAIIVVDVESTCWKSKAPPGEESEIIEIGICLLDIATATPVEKESILVKPERSRVSDFCTELTTLTQEQVDKGISFAEACEVLKSKYESGQRVWASYGDYDRNMFEKQTLSRGIKYPFSPKHINVKTLLAVALNWQREVGMARALQTLEIPLEGTHHRGGDDAWNIAKILGSLFLQARGKK
jgi:inhibitor of KinA sporulation pathway (predicted exonuclease)